MMNAHADARANSTSTTTVPTVIGRARAAARTLIGTSDCRALNVKPTLICASSAVKNGQLAFYPYSRYASKPMNTSTKSTRRLRKPQSVSENDQKEGVASENTTTDELMSLFFERMKEDSQLKELFKEGDLQGANLNKANLRHADLQRANLQEANLEYADLYNANLWGANLTEAELCGANLTGACLQKAEFRGADLRWAKLQGLSLSGANLNKANLQEALLCEANLSRARLHFADLSRADLSGANLRKAYLQTAILPDGWREALEAADLI